MRDIREPCTPPVAQSLSTKFEHKVPKPAPRVKMATSKQAQASSSSSSSSTAPRNLLLALAPIAAIAAYLVACVIQPPPVESLASLGSVSADSASIYIQSAPTSDLSCGGIQAMVMYRPSTEMDSQWSSLVTGLEGGPDNHMRSCSKVAKLQKLKASTRYEYIVTMPSENTPPLSGHFTTFHSPGAKSVVTFTFSSCLGYWPLSSIFPLKWLSPSDFFLLLGDSIYADWPWNMGLGYEALYLNLVQDRHFKALSRSVPVMAMFDDHEIKDNWAGGRRHPWDWAIGNWTTFLGGRNQGHLNDPSKSKGGGSQFRLQTGGVCLFVADVRSERDAAKKTIFGAHQVDEIKSWLKAPGTKCSIKILASPVTFALFNGSAAVNEGWDGASSERDAILDAAASGAGGSAVLIISGDSHWGAVYDHGRGIKEVSASPLFQIGLSPSFTGSSIATKTDFLSTYSLHFSRVVVDTRETPSVALSLYASWLGLLPPKVVWNATYPLSDLTPSPVA